MRQIKTNKVIFSVYQNDVNPMLNQLAHATTLKTLDLLNIEYMEVDGVYKGVAEKSILLQSHDYERNFKNIEKAKTIASDFNQESILAIENDDTAQLYYLAEDRIETVGKWVEVDTVDNLDGFSVIEGRKFTIR